MRRWSGAVALAGLALWAAAPLAAQDNLTVALVRHAEKAGGPDPVLTAAGTARALALRDALSDFGVDAIIVSQFRRTQLTAQPLADRLGLAPEVIPVVGSVADHIAAVVAAVRRHGAAGDAVVLVVGHSNTIPAIARALGGQVPDLSDEAYDDVFLVHLGGSGATSLRVRYGASNGEGVRHD